MSKRISVEYQDEQVSIYKLGKLSGIPLTTLYRAYRNGFSTGDELIAEAKRVAEAKKQLVEYKGEFMTIQALCSKTKSNYGSVKRRLDSGMSAEQAVSDSTDRRGVSKATKLSPSDVMNIYVRLFNKEASQTLIANEYGVHSSTISDIWRHKHWGWLTSALRYQLENGLLE